ncbi:DUF3467 domain-containing protein [Vaginella massiliensis]|uniref:DUF3467 domain-containing protein n=1 Tax=Vaginella massiliensis TaxID=1816680 RepID=UPI000838667C|nr:DUF3467 domain-containing protein [Vaginella massiliensis]
MSENQQNEGLNIELNEMVAQGVYATGAIINHSPSEFVVDFIQFMPGARPSVKSRIILSPLQAKALVKSLTENVSNYEKNFGEIVEPKQNLTANFEA